MFGNFFFQIFGGNPEYISYTMNKQLRDTRPALSSMCNVPDGLL